MLADTKLCAFEPIPPKHQTLIPTKNSHLKVSSVMLMLTLLILFACRSRKGEVSDEIFDMLLSFTDFLTFKQAMLDYKAVSS